MEVKLEPPEYPTQTAVFEKRFKNITHNHDKSNVLLLQSPNGIILLQLISSEINRKEAIRIKQEQNLRGGSIPIDLTNCLSIYLPKGY